MTSIKICMLRPPYTKAYDTSNPHHHFLPVTSASICRQ